MVTKNKYLWAKLLQEVWGNYGYEYLGNATDAGYDTYRYSADVPIIFAKLFNTNFGESADIHIFCCTESEDTSVRNIKKIGYWGCSDTPEYSEYTGQYTPPNTCEWYQTNPIQRCNDHGHHGANDNCCICKMVKNMNEDADPDLRPNVGPDCKVRECKQTLEQKNIELASPPSMIIPQDNWDKNNLWTGELEATSDLNPEYSHRKMQHIENAWRYVSDIENLDYGKLKLI